MIRRAFVLQLHFLLRVARIEEGIHLRNDVEGNLMRKNLTLDRLAGYHRLRLLFQFLDGQRAGAGNRLVTGRKYPLHAELLDAEDTAPSA